MITRIIAVSEVSKSELLGILKGKSSKIRGCDNGVNFCFTISQDISDYCDNCLFELLLSVVDKKVKVVNGGEITS